MTYTLTLTSAQLEILEHVFVEGIRIEESPALTELTEKIEALLAFGDEPYDEEDAGPRTLPERRAYEAAQAKHPAFRPPLGPDDAFIDC